MGILWESVSMKQLLLNHLFPHYPVPGTTLGTFVELPSFITSTPCICKMLFNACYLGLIFSWGSNQSSLLRRNVLGFSEDFTSPHVSPQIQLRIKVLKPTTTPKIKLMTRYYDFSRDPHIINDTC